MKYTLSFVSIFLSLFILSGCTETIVQEPDDKLFTNDLLHADLVGKIVQKNSGAIVIVSQEIPVDTAQVNPIDGSFAFRDLRAGNYDVTIIANQYRIFRRTNVVLTGGTIAYFGEVTLSTVPDEVESFYPEDNAEVVYDWRYGRITVSILFARPMDRESVEKAFKVEPAAEGIFYWGNFTREPVYGLYSDALGFSRGATITTFSKVASMTYHFARKDSYPDSTYVITIDTTAKDTLGNHLRFPFKFKFKTVQSYSTQNGIMTDPIHGDIDISPINYNGITITFPRRMDKASVEALTSVQPSMSTVFLWPEENKLRIYTGGPFLSDTTITVSINKEAKDKDGVKLGHDYTFSFRTAELKVDWTSPLNGQLFVTPNNEVVITFNNYVKLASAKNITISPAVTGQWQYGGYSPYENKNQLVFYTSGFKLNTKYTFTVTEVENMYGTKMKAPYSFSFVTRP